VLRPENRHNVGGSSARERCSASIRRVPQHGQAAALPAHGILEPRRLQTRFAAPALTTCQCPNLTPRAGLCERPPVGMPCSLMLVTNNTAVRSVSGVPRTATESTDAQHIQPRCRCSTRHWHASTKFGVGGAAHVKRATTPHATPGVRCCRRPSQPRSLRSWAHHYTDKMPAAAIEEARESVLGVSLEYDPDPPCVWRLSHFSCADIASRYRYRSLEQPKAQGGSARLAPLA
jgi:hypothetical protein